MAQWKRIFFTGLLVIGVILLSMEIIELITGVPILADMEFWAVHAS
jgi:hypothetical protein